MHTATAQHPWGPSHKALLVPDKDSTLSVVFINPCRLCGQDRPLQTAPWGCFTQHFPPQLKKIPAVREAVAVIPIPLGISHLCEMKIMPLCLPCPQVTSGLQCCREIPQELTVRFQLRQIILYLAASVLPPFPMSHVVRLGAKLERRRHHLILPSIPFLGPFF